MSEWMSRWMNEWMNERMVLRDFVHSGQLSGRFNHNSTSYFDAVFSLNRFLESVARTFQPYACWIVHLQKQCFSPNVHHLPRLGNELHYIIQQFQGICKIITPLSSWRLVIGINVSLIKLAAGLSLRNTTIRSHGTRAQKRVLFTHQDLLPTSLIRRNRPRACLPTQYWLLIKWPWYMPAKENEKTNGHAD